MERIAEIFRFSEQSPMVFTTLDFWVFFIAVYVVFALVASKTALRNFFLLVASLFFYYKTSGTFLLLLVFSILFSFGAGRLLARAKDALDRKVVLALSITVHLAFLCYFKYAYFFADAVELFSGEALRVFNPLALLGNSLLQGSYFTVDKILLPVGISFFTFQIITYLVDVYRGHTAPVRSMVDYGFYVSFFPPLVAGPIVRAADFIPQLHTKSLLTKAEFGMALFLVLKGLFKKIFIGDYMAVNFIDRVFANPLAYTGLENITALVAYSLQVYVDFSGYTDIAIGLALMMGFRLRENFNSPYKAVSVADFWRRWHISLSHFLRDYLYIPLGGNKRGALRTNANLMFTMLLGGLWHGASWNFIIWGAINGVGLLVYKAWRRVSPYENATHWAVRVWRVVFTFTFITFTRLWFRSPDTATVNQFTHRVRTNFGWDIALHFVTGFKTVLAVMVLGFVLHWLGSGFKNRWRDRFVNAHPIAQALVCVAVVFIIYQSISAKAQPFIYFQF